MQYLMMAFVAVWLIVTLYVVYMGQRQRQLEEEMHTLEEMVAENKQKRND